MQVDAAETLRPGFLNDYVAECGEHLTAVRRALVQLESTVGGTPARAVVDELFHAFHSLKGLSGMVGFRHAEELAHEMESFLRRLQQAPESLTISGYGALVDATRSLEDIVADATAGSATADIQSVVDRLAGQAGVPGRRHVHDHGLMRGSGRT